MKCISAIVREARSLFLLVMSISMKENRQSHRMLVRASSVLEGVYNSAKCLDCSWVGVSNLAFGNPAGHFRLGCHWSTHRDHCRAIMLTSLSHHTRRQLLRIAFRSQWPQSETFHVLSYQDSKWGCKYKVCRTRTKYCCMMRMMMVSECEQSERN